MTGRQNLYVLALYGAIILTTVVGAVILGFHGTLDPASITAIFGTAVGGSGAALAGQGALTSAVNGKAVLPSSVIGAREETLRQAIRTGQETPQA